MTFPTRLIEGQVEDVRDRRIRDLEAQVDLLQRLVVEAQDETRQYRANTDDAFARLRQQLSPLYRALQGVFGELDAAGVDEPAGQSSPVKARAAAVWESWQQKLGASSAPARVIEALLAHGELNVAQLKVAAKMATQTVYDATSKLNRLGLITKNGGRISLKAL